MEGENLILSCNNSLQLADAECIYGTGREAVALRVQVVITSEILMLATNILSSP